MVRIASATGVPCATRTSTWRSFATISSGLCLFLDMGPSSFGSYEPYLRADHFMGGGSLGRGDQTGHRDLPGFQSFRRAAEHPERNRELSPWQVLHDCEFAA